MISREEVCSLQLPPPWKLRGNILNYGLGLLSSYFVSDALTILSAGYFYVFDPLGLAGGATSTATSSARFFSLIGAVYFHYLRNKLVEAWNEELMLCVRDSYVEMVLEFQKLRKDPTSSAIESSLSPFSRSPSWPPHGGVVLLRRCFRVAPTSSSTLAGRCYSGGATPALTATTTPPLPQLCLWCSAPAVSYFLPLCLKSLCCAC